MKAVLKRLESGAVFSAMSEDGVESGLMVALQAINSTGRTRLIKRGAVKNPVCNTPKASSVSAGGVERVRSDGKKLIERLRGRPTRGQVPEFAEVNHFRNTQRLQTRQNCMTSGA